MRFVPPTLAELGWGTLVVGGVGHTAIALVSFVHAHPSRARMGHPQSGWDGQWGTLILAGMGNGAPSFWVGRAGGCYWVGSRWAAAILARMRFSASPLQYLQSRRMKTEV